MARWPKEQPSTWYSQYKRGSLVSGHGAACLRHGLARLCMGLTSLPSATPALAAGQTAARPLTATQAGAPPATQRGSRLAGSSQVQVEDVRVACRAPAPQLGAAGVETKGARSGGLILLGPRGQLR